MWGADILKRIVIIDKNLFLFATAILLLVCGTIILREFNYETTPQVNTISVLQTHKTYFEPNKPANGSIEELYQDIFMTQLLPCISKEVKDYYKKHTGYSPWVDPWQPDILYIKRPNGYRTFLFEIKLEVAPYLGPHCSIGVDHITLMVLSEEVRVIKFEHIKNIPIPPHVAEHLLLNSRHP